MTLRRGIGSVYFALCRDAIKIGYTEKAASIRVRQIDTCMPWPVVLLASIVGTPQDELNAHEELTSFRRRGEWFDDCPEVRAYIKKVATP